MAEETIKKVESWQDVDEILREMGQLLRKIGAYEKDLNELIDKFKVETLKLTQPLRERQTLLELQMEKFTRAHRAEIPGQSRALNFGEVGFRRSTKLAVEWDDFTLSCLEALGRQDCIKIVKVLDKTALGRMDDDTLFKIGVDREKGEKFRYKVNEQKLKLEEA